MTSEQVGRLDGGAAASILAATRSLKEGAEERAGCDADAHADRHADRHTEAYGDPCTRASVTPHPSPPPHRVSHSGRRLRPVAGQGAANADTETEARR